MRRCVIKCIHAAKLCEEDLASALFSLWSDKSADAAIAVLEKPDVKVTNQRDKTMQLKKIRDLEAQVETMTRSFKWCEVEAQEFESGPPTMNVKVHPAANDVFMSAAARWVNLITCIGKVRTGKSYLMNALAGEEVFEVSGRAASFTIGTHVSAQLHPGDKFGLHAEASPLVGFADMEGLSDKSSAYDATLAMPVLLLSKIIILNVVCPNGPSRREILETLKVMVDTARRISQSGPRRSVFGCLHVVLRDCMNDEAECHGLIFDEESLDDVPSDTASIHERNWIRKELARAFECEPKTWCLPKLLVVADAPIDYLENPATYVNKLKEIRASMGKQLASPKFLHEEPLTGAKIAALADALSQALSQALWHDGSISVPSLIDAAFNLQAEPMVRSVLEEFNHGKVGKRYAEAVALAEEMARQLRKRLAQALVPDPIISRAVEALHAKMQLPEREGADGEEMQRALKKQVFEQSLQEQRYEHLGSRFNTLRGNHEQVLFQMSELNQALKRERTEKLWRERQLQEEANAKASELMQADTQDEALHVLSSA